MWNPFRIGGFERRLVLAFLLLSVIPVVAIGLIVSRYFMNSVQLVSNPAVEQSFRNSMEIARDFSAKLEEDAACAAARLAEVVAAKPGAAHGELAASIKNVSEETHVDFAAIYTLDGSSWRLVLSYPTAMPRLESLIEPSALLDAGRVVFKDPDVIASSAVAGGTLAVTGFTLEKGFADKMRRTGDDLSRYNAVGLYVKVLRRYIIIVTCVLIAILAVASTAVSRLIARRISQPITELASATEEIAKGNLEYRVNVSARDEVLSLVNGFNKMTADLEENKRNLIAMAKREAQVARDFEIARQVQESLFPTTLPAIPGWQFAAICRAAKVVGGDYYDVFEVASGRVLIAQGDVSGKGVGASLTMASVHAIVRSSGAAVGSNPADLPARLVQELSSYLLSSRTPELFVTLFLGLLDCGSGTLSYVNCGHPPAVLLPSSGAKPEALDIGGTVLGISAGLDYAVGQCRLAAGDTLVLVSDGVTEATSAGGEMFGEVHLEGVLSRARGQSAADTMQRILGGVEDLMAGAEQGDDISILVLKRAG